MPVSTTIAPAGDQGTSLPLMTIAMGAGGGGSLVIFVAIVSWRYYHIKGMTQDDYERIV